MGGSVGIRCRNNAGVVCQFRVRTHGAETDLGGRKAATNSSTWSYDELIAAGFKEGDDCWVSVDIIAGVTNHESGSNFTLQKDAPFTLVYTLFGGTLTPSWRGPEEAPVLHIMQKGAFVCRIRVRTNGKETDLSRTMTVDMDTGWTFTELSGYGFNDGDDCWLSVDVEAGRTNHESGDNFTLRKNTPVMANYTLSGTVWFPSWSRGEDKPWTEDDNW